MNDQLKSSTSEIADSCIAGRLRVLDRAIQGIYDEELRPLGVRMTQMAVLVAISTLGRPAAGEVASALWLDRSTLSRNLVPIERRGWVRILPGHDARTRVLELTAKGRHLIDRALPTWRNCQERARELLGEPAARSLCEAGTRLMKQGQQT